MNTTAKQVAVKARKARGTAQTARVALWEFGQAVYDRIATLNAKPSKDGKKANQTTVAQELVEEGVYSTLNSAKASVTYAVGFYNRYETVEAAKNGKTRSETKVTEEVTRTPAEFAAKAVKQVKTKAEAKALIAALRKEFGI